MADDLSRPPDKERAGAHGGFSQPPDVGKIISDGLHWPPDVGMIISDGLHWPPDIGLGAHDGFSRPPDVGKDMADGRHWPLDNRARRCPRRLLLAARRQEGYG